MIKDVMVRLDGTSGDDLQLAAANLLAETFDSHVTGLFFNVLPPRLSRSSSAAPGADQATEPGDAAKKAGEAVFEHVA
jgi:hypothetical protein